MSTVKTSTLANATGDALSSRHLLDRCQNGVLWDFSRDEPTSNTTTPKFSTDNGATWTAASTIPGLSQASVFIDLDDYAHLAWRQSGTSGPNASTLTAGIIYYTRGTPNAGRTAYTWATPVAVTNNTNCQWPDLVSCRNSATSGWDAFVVCSYLSGTDNRALYARVPISSGGVFGTVATDGLTAFVTAGTLGGPYTVGINTYPSIDFHHTGDGKTVAGSAPHLYVLWNSGTTGVGKGLRYKKATFSAGSWTWGTEREPRDTGFALTAAGDWLNCLYDGTRVLIAYQAAGYFVCDERNEADTTITGDFGSDGTALQQMLYGGITYDSAGNVYVFGRDGSTGANGTRLLKHRKWTRATGTFAAPTTLDSTTPDAPYVSARRGYAGSAADILYTDGTVTPWTVTFIRTPTNVAPNAPTSLSPTGGVTIDRGVTNRFSWTFTDPDTGDTQSLADIRYRLAGTTPWTDVLGAATTSAFWDATGGTFAAGNWEWQVRAYDALGTAGPYSASSFFTAATSPATPTITAPVNGATISANSQTVTWSAPNQDAYQVRTVADVAGAADTSTVYTDSGTVIDAVGRARTVTFAVTGRTEHIQVRVQKSTLWSAWADSRNPISFTPPAAPTATVTAQTATGTLTVAVTNPTPTGGQPTVANWDIYRREVKAGVPQTATEIRVAAALITSYVDRTVASRKDYQYKVRATASNGTWTDSAWT